MIQQTEMMREILTNEMAQRIIDFVSRKYGNSYAGLWLFQVIGAALDGVYKDAEKLQGEITPATAELLLAAYERHYGLVVDESLTTEQRQLRLLAKIQAKGPGNPARLEEATSKALGGVPVEITERYAKNTFLVTIREVVPDLAPAKAVLDRMKPAHLIYTTRVDVEAEVSKRLTMAAALTFAERHEVEIEMLLGETVEARLTATPVFTHSEKYTLEVS